MIIVKYLLFLIPVSILLLYFSRVDRIARKEWPFGLMAYGPGSKKLLIFCWCGLLTLTWIMCVSNQIKTPRDVATSVAAFVLMVTACTVLQLEISRVSINYDNSEIRTKSPWRKSRVICWSEIVKITYSVNAKWYVIKTKTNGSIHCHTSLVGLEQFLLELVTRGIELPVNAPHRIVKP